jgi:hypothetical protein
MFLPDPAKPSEPREISSADKATILQSRDEEVGDGREELLLLAA